MNGRLMLLHLRAREVALPLAGLVVIAVAGWWTADQIDQLSPLARLPLVIGAPMIAAVLLGPGFAGADPLLERSTALPWRRWRLAHALLATALAAMAMAVITPAEPTPFEPVELIRNGVGLVGMTFICAVLVGARVAWLPVLAYGCYALPLVPAWDDANAVERVLGWSIFPSDTVLSIVVAGVLWLVGTVLYVRFGAVTSGRAGRAP